MNIIFLIIIGIFSRLAPHLPNMTPVGALALFSGSMLGFKKTFIVTFAVMMISDLILGFHPVMWATYGSLVFAILLGKFAVRPDSLISAAKISFISSAVFFVLTNFAVWLTPNFMYPKTISGLIECYVMALPFWRNSLMGDMGYGLIFFSAYRLILRNKPRIFFTKNS